MRLLKLHKTKAQKKAGSSDFSRFFREASSAEKKRVFLDVAKKASEDQRAVIDSVHSHTTTPVK